MNLTLFSKCGIYNFEKLFANKGYSFFTKGNYNLNIIGVRSNQHNKVTNSFDDFLIVDYNSPNGHERKVYTMTTEAGLTYMLKPSTTKGTAILVPGQYKGVYTLALHNGKYKALCQRLGTVKVYRDSNKDKVYDLKPETIDEGLFGINIHRANETWTRANIDNYSAGCQVLNNPKEFNEFIAICDKAKSIYGNKFTYTLITEEDMV